MSYKVCIEDLFMISWEDWYKIDSLYLAFHQVVLRPNIFGQDVPLFHEYVELDLEDSEIRLYEQIDDLPTNTFKITGLVLERA